MTPWILPEPMLTTAVDSSELPAGHAAEIKWDGFRAGLSIDAGHVVLRSRNGTQMAPAFPEIVAAAAQLPDASALDGELIVWESGRLAFERLQDRLRRRGAAAARAAEEWPAHFVAFDLLRLSGTSTTGWSYRRRRAALEQVFTDRGLGAPWALCPSTTDPAMVREWLTWTTATGLEGILFKPLDSLYRPGARGGVEEVQAARDDRGPRGRGHGISSGAPDSAPGPVRRGRLPALHRPHHHPLARRRAERRRLPHPRLGPGRASLGWLVVLSGVGQHPTARGRPGRA
ncbi:hypothetical protein ABZ626_37905 [Streptomyces longispororuber]|uniref:ATP-dependent DNA ligase n=1 Tax=Streptomyces longispororuber TaxID=68230 RepID=UPI0033FD43D5